MSDLLALRDGKLYLLTDQYVSSTDEPAQRVTSLLLKDYDEVTQLGTRFPQLLRQGDLLTNAGLINEFAIAASLVMSQLGDQTALPTSQQVRRVRLDTFNRTTSALQLTISLAMADKTTKIVPTITITA